MKTCDLVRFVDSGASGYDAACSLPAGHAPVSGGCQGSPEITSPSFEPDDLEKAAARVLELRSSILADGDMAGASVMAEPHFLMVMSLLEQASLNLKLASYHQAQAIAGSKRYFSF